ncbi:hypothetical protein [Nocardioides sp. SR21]|uniref:hypothetical protein n=1 Tax=Nocardioides sp. SR21 TaxID=2919501 RepID=UPI001FA9511D|nr:hypothetical protein [Nocardioides sp. SR21]
MITTFRTLTAAGAASLALIGGAALTGSTATADDGATKMPARPAQKALVSTCNGGPSLGLFYRSMDFQSVASGTTTDVEGSQWQVKGPKKGTDTVLVTLTAMASSGGAGELTSVSFYKDGVGTSEGTKYFTYNNVLDQASVSFCTKIPKGNHTLTLRVSDGGGGATTLYFPTVSYQRFS